MASQEGATGEDGSATINPIPGLLTFRKLTVNKGQMTLNEKRIKQMITDQEYYIKCEIFSQAFTNGIRNFAGLLYFHSHSKDMAVQSWEQTLKLDPLNLNALQDLATAYKQMRFNKMAIKYESKLKKAIEVMTQDDADQNEDRNKMVILARCRMEQAYAHFSDLHTKLWTGIDLRKDQVESFKAAFDSAGAWIDRDKHKAEKRDWLLFLAKAHERLCHTFFRMGQKDSYLKEIGKATEYLHKCLELSDGDTVQCTEVWITMGNTFSCNSEQVRENIQHNKIPSIVTSHYAHEWRDPSLCYRKALEIDSQNTWIKARWGIHLSKQGTDFYKDALERLNQAIQEAENLPEDDPVRKSCWNAYIHRAKIVLKKAKNENDNPKSAHTLLCTAKEDTIKALNYLYIPTNLVLYGEVHHHLAQNKFTNPEDKETFRQRALISFTEASEIEDGNLIPDTHLKWARCLSDSDDLPSAIEAYKVALDTSTGDRKFTQMVAKELLCTMLQNYQIMNKAQELKREIAFWFIYIHNYFTEPTFNFKRLPKKYASEIMDVMEYMVHSYVSHYSDALDLSSSMLKPTLQALTELYPRRRSEIAARLARLTRENDDYIHNFKANSQVHRTRPVFQNPPHKALAEGCSYDFYVINDEDHLRVDGWVQYALLTGLECPFYGLKGYYHKRDLALGNFDIKSRIDAIPTCANIVIVISHDFDSTCELLVEVSQQLKGKDVIIVQREPAEIPRNLRISRRFDFTVQANIPELARHLLPIMDLNDY